MKEYIYTHTRKINTTNFDYNLMQIYFQAERKGILLSDAKSSR